MAGTIKVSTTKLRNTANSFRSSGNTIKTLTNQMTSLVSGLSGQVWEGDAAKVYRNQFNGLQDDINRMIKMINEHVQDLNEMAAEYEKAERENQEQARGLSSDVII